MAGHGKKNMPMQKPKNTGKTVKRIFAYLT